MRCFTCALRQNIVRCVVDLATPSCSAFLHKSMGVASLRGRYSERNAQRSKCEQATMRRRAGSRAQRTHCETRLPALKSSKVLSFLLLDLPSETMATEIVKR